MVKDKLWNHNTVLPQLVDLEESSETNLYKLVEGLFLFKQYLAGTNLEFEVVCLFWMKFINKRTL